MGLFSAALGFAGSIYGANKADKRAKAALAQQQYEFERTREMQGANLAITLADQKAQREENAYRRVMERLNRMQTSEERRFAQDELRDYKKRILSERAESIRRQVQEDKEAARMQELYLTTILERQDLAEEERAFAIEQLKEAQAIASGERDEELIRFLEDREEKKIEREFYEAEYAGARDLYQQERDLDLAQRQDILDRIDAYSSAVAGVEQDLPFIPQPARLDGRMIADEFNRRSREYQGDVDRAATLTASINEADLIRGGIDMSTPGTMRRANITREIADKYQDARRRAYDDALSYITGKTDALNQNIGTIMGQRKAMIQDRGALAGAGLEYLNLLPEEASASGYLNLLAGTPTGILNRDISSANDYRAPVAISSGIYDGGDRAYGMSRLAPWLNPRSAAYMGANQIPTGVYNPYTMSIGTKEFGNNSALSGAMMTAASQTYQNALDDAQRAGAGVAATGRDLFEEVGSWGKSKWGSGRSDGASKHWLWDNI